MGSLDWSDAAPADRPNRRWVEVVCCPACQSLDIERASSAGGIAYWCCKACPERWREPDAVGRDRARVA